MDIYGKFCFIFSLITNKKVYRRNNMGKMGFPFYGEDIGSAIETAEKVLAKVKTNKFDKADLKALADAMAEIILAYNGDEG
jgi:DNA transposition AAA+ family ATPase